MESSTYYNSQGQSSNLNVSKGKHPFNKTTCIVITERSAFGMSKVYIDPPNIGLLIKTVLDIVVKDCGLMK